MSPDSHRSLRPQAAAQAAGVFVGVGALARGIGLALAALLVVVWFCAFAGSFATLSVAVDYDPVSLSLRADIGERAVPYLCMAASLPECPPEQWDIGLTRLDTILRANDRREVDILCIPRRT